MKLNYKILTYLLIVISTVFRLIVAANIELGNDEVYYWLYALYPDLSHFDHPAMVGFFIQFFTLNLYFDSELFLRLAAIIPAGLNMLILFKIGQLIKNDFTGFLSVILYNISIYGLVISGIFILPDAPLLFFWLLSFFFFLKSIPNKPTNQTKINLLLGFLFTGLAIYSKYQAVYLLFGVGMYIILFNRVWLKKRITYLGLIFPIIAVGLIYYWNYKNDFISFSFHNNRVSLFSLNFDKDSFLREILGQFLYNNPYVFVLFIITIWSYYKKKFTVDKKLFWFFLLFTVPLIFTTIYLSLFRDTLPHWSGIAYLTFLPMIAYFMTQKNKFIKGAYYTLGMVFFLLVLGIGIVNKGWFIPEIKNTDNTKLGKKDVTLDMYGWKQAAKKIDDFLNQNKNLYDLPFISNRWYPASHFDYYVAKPLQKNIFVLGDLNKIHKYYWINKERGGFKGSGIFITDSRNFTNPELLYKSTFSKYELLTTIPIYRNEIWVKNIFLYKLSD